MYGATIVQTVLTRVSPQQRLVEGLLLDRPNNINKMWSVKIISIQ
jgi:hypothetical protein